MTTDYVLIPLGELLLKAGILSLDQVESALERARERGLPFGKVLVLQELIRQRDLRSVIEAQSLINDGMIQGDTAAEAIKLVVSDGIRLTEALSRLGWTKPRRGTTNRIGELLVEAETISWEQLDDALKTSSETGLPVGRVLVFKRSITSQMLLACLTAQKLIREGAIGRNQAVQGLKAVRQREVNFEESMDESPYLKSAARRSTPIGTLLIKSGLLDKEKLMECMEVSLTEEKPIGEVFIERRCISRAMLKAALKIQDMVELNTLDDVTAANALRQVAKQGCSVVKAVAEAGMPALDREQRLMVIELLALSGLADPAELKELFGSNLTETCDLVRDLLSSDMVTEAGLYALLRAAYFIDRKLIVPEDAIMALHECKSQNKSFDQALKELGWTPPPVVRPSG